MLAFIVSTASFIVIFITVIVRANDQKLKPGLRWHVRMFGLVLAGCSPIGIFGYELVTQNWPNIYDALFRVGLAMVFMTTPGQPPWHKMVWKGTDE